jgi:hypothetical protein
VTLTGWGDSDLAWDQQPVQCMRTIAARSFIDEISKRHVVQLSITFHSGDHLIAWPWGDMIHCPRKSNTLGLREAARDDRDGGKAAFPAPPRVHRRPGAVLSPPRPGCTGAPAAPGRRRCRGGFASLLLLSHAPRTALTVLAHKRCATAAPSELPSGSDPLVGA